MEAIWEKNSSVGSDSERAIGKVSFGYLVELPEWGISLSHCMFYYVMAAATICSYYVISITISYVL
jgi:hypothetical protein